MKWHLGSAGDSPTEDAYGYDAFATFNGSKVNPIKKDGLASVDHAEKFIREHKDESFFVNLWLHEVHLAHFPQPRYLEKFKDLDEQKRVYASVIAEGDEGVGRILDLLKELNLDDNTQVVFSTDNGPEVTRDEKNKIHHKGEEGLGGYYSVGETAELKGRKRSLFSGGIRVPLIVRWPGVIPAGKTDNVSVLTAVDLLPTFLEVARGTLPVGYLPDGESVLSAFKGGQFSRTHPIFWEWKGGDKQDFTWPTLGVHDGKWKLLHGTENQLVELYDLKTDWAETKNVAAENPDVVKRLSAQLQAWKSELPRSPSESALSAAREKKKS